MAGGEAEMMFAAPPPAGQPEVPWLLRDPRIFTLFFAAIWIDMNLFISWSQGFFRLYAVFPPTPEDPIEARFFWVQFSRAMSHGPVSVKLGRTCVHIREVFPFRPLFWKGPASIPYEALRIDKSSSRGFWSFLSQARFEIMDLGIVFSLSGKAGRQLEGRLEAREVVSGGASLQHSIQPH